MTRLFGLNRLAYVNLLVACASLGLSARNYAQVKWLVALDAREPWRAALDRAARTREPVLAFVFLENQQLSVLMEEGTFADAAVEKATGDFLCVRVNANEARNRPFLEAYNVGRREFEVTITHIPGPDEPPPKDPNAVYETTKGRNFTYPVTLFINPDGELEHIVYGYARAEDFLHVMSQVKEIMRVHETLRDKPDDARSLAELGSLYVGLGRYGAGQQALERALAADQDGKQNVAETALLDLAIAYMAAERNEQAIEVIRRHVATYPESKERCKAQFLLGGALLASVEADRIKVEELAGQANTEEATAARQRLFEGRREAEKAWSWFEGPKGQAPCEGTEWSEYSLGALKELRAEMGYAAVSEQVEVLMAEGKVESAVQRLRAFAKEHAGSDRACEALFRVGELLMKSGKREEALAQWRNLSNADPKANPCARTPWRAQADTALQESR